MSDIFRTGPFPEASDYSKTLIDCLQDENFKIGSVSRIQQLLLCLVERLHDAIYVLPRHLNDARPDPREYARDIFHAIKALRKFSQQLPSDQEQLGELNEQLSKVKEENRAVMQKLLHLETLIKHSAENSI